MRDLWQSAGSYEAYIGRWSRPLARLFAGGSISLSAKAWVAVGRKGAST